MNRPKLVIFDCDGVLVDSEPITNAILQKDLAKRGLDLKLDEVIRMFVGGTMKRVGEIAAEMGADIPEYWLNDIYDQMYARLARGTPMIDGIGDLLDRLDGAAIPYCVGSNGSEQKMEITLGQHPILWDRLQERLFSAHRYGTAKPDPDLYMIAAKTCGVDPTDCVVVDDSPSGCAAARDAGMRCLGLAEHDDGARLAAKGAQIIHSLREVPELIGL